MSQSTFPGLDHRDTDWLSKQFRRWRPLMEWYFRPVFRGFDQLPDEPFLLVANHNGGPMMPDALLLNMELFRQLGPERHPHSLAHEILFKLPGMGRSVVRWGALPASHGAAEAAFARGHNVLVFPGGDVEVNRPYWQRNRIDFDGRTGYISLALRQGVPIVPVVTAGAHQIYVVLNDGRKLAAKIPLAGKLRVRSVPITLTLPWGLNPYPPPAHLPIRSRIYMQALPALQFARSGPEAAEDEAYVRACDVEVRAAMQTVLDELADERRQKGELTYFERAWERLGLDRLGA